MKVGNGDISQRFLTAVDSLLLPLRAVDGFSEDAFLELSEVLQTYAELWSTSEFVPKREMSVLVDLYPAIAACSHLYQGEEAAAVMQAADTIADLIRRCVAVEWRI